MGWASCPPKLQSQARCLCHNNFTGKMPVPQRFHRQDACATKISQARFLCHKNFTGKIPVSQRFHRQDSCVTKISQARCLCHKDFTGKMPVPQKFLWGGHLARPKYLKSPKDRPHKQPLQLTLHWDSKQDELASFLTANPSGLCA